MMLSIHRTLNFASGFFSVILFALFLTNTIAQQPPKIAQPPTIYMPYLIGGDVQQVGNHVEVRRYQLNVQRIARVDATAQINSIIDQSPRARTIIRTGQSVVVYYAIRPTPPERSQNQFRMPRLVGLSVQEARTQIASIERQLSLRVNISQIQPPQTMTMVPPLGKIIRQLPAENSILENGQPVTLFVYAYQQPSLEMPNLIGGDVSNVTNNILVNRYRIQLTKLERESSTARVNSIIDQSPRPRTAIRMGQAATVYYAVRPQVQVPPLINLTYQQAQLTLGRVGLRGSATRVPRRTTPDIVISQSPTAGTRVNPNSVVSIEVSMVPTTTVPNLINQPITTASTLVSNKELAIQTSSVREENSVPEKTVLSQFPAAGATVPIGTIVQVVISKQNKIAVPNILSKTSREASTLIRNKKLTPGISHEINNSAREGLVFRQSPSAGTLVFPGATVSAVIAQPEMVQVPEVRNKKVQDAVAALNEKKLRTPSSLDAEGIISRQSPAAGTEVRINSEVLLFLSPTPSPTVTVTPVREQQITPVPPPSSPPPNSPAVLAPLVKVYPPHYGVAAIAAGLFALLLLGKTRFNPVDKKPVPPPVPPIPSLRLVTDITGSPQVMDMPILSRIEVKIIPHLDLGMPEVSSPPPLVDTERIRYE